MEKYERLVNKAKELIEVKKKAKWKICAIAEEVCTIKVGGHNKSGFYTIKKFADDIGMNRKTLSEWLSEYQVYKALTLKQQEKATTKQIRDVNELRRKGNIDTKQKTKIRDLYKERSSLCPEDLAIKEIKQRLHYYVGVISSDYVLKLLNQNDLMDIKESSETIYNLIQIKESSRKIAKKLGNHFNG